VRALLAALGRSARWALPAGVFVGVAVPPLAALAKPLLTAAVIGTLTAALLRLDWAGLARTVRQPARPAWVVAWLLVVSPAVCWIGAGALGLPADLRLALLLQWAAPPIGSAAVFALILGVDGLLAMVGAVAATLLLPLTLTPMVALLLPSAGVQVDLAAFAARVALVVGAPFAIAGLLRAVVGSARLARADDVLGGLNVLLLVVFAVAVMDGVTETLIADPPAIVRLLVTACASAALLHGAGRVLLGRADPRAGWAAALLSGNRNMGLMLAITAGTAGPTFSLYVGVAQIPMYFAPLLLGPWVRRSLAGAAAGRRTDP
jgi:BASS family bile acid:Na+ symporter